MKIKNIFITVYLISCSVLLSSAVVSLLPKMPEDEIVKLIIFEEVVALSVFFFSRHILRLKPYTITPKRTRKLWSIYVIGLIFCLLAEVIIGFLLPSPVEKQKVLQDTLSNSAEILITSFTAPLVEEYVFRYTIRRIFRSDVTWVLVSSVLFALCHIQFVHGDIYSSIYPMISTFIVGLILATAYRKSNHLIVPIAIHSSLNTIIIILQYLS